MNGCGSDGCGNQACSTSDQPEMESMVIGGDSAESQSQASCMKCNTTPAEIIVRQRDPVCGPCAWELTSQKVRQALRLRIGLDRTDLVMLCLSGGHCSRTLLHMLLEYQTPDKSRPSRSKVGFDLLVAHVDVGAAAGWSIADSDAHVKEIYRSVAGHVSAEQFCSLHLEDAYLDAPDAEIAPGDREHRRKRVYDLVQAIEDSTGREDLVKMLREAVLLSYGKSRGVTRLAKGDSSDRLAARVIALAAKGDGYSLPSTLHFIDSRQGKRWPMWISPCRELLSKDLAALAHFQRLTTVPQTTIPLHSNQPSINALSEKFIAGLQVSMPSAVYAVLGTACKLQAFSWNRKVSLDTGGDGGSLCILCTSPVSPIAQAGDLHSMQHSSAIRPNGCCETCWHQFCNVILDQDSPSVGLLPQYLRDRITRNEQLLEGQPVPVSRECMYARIEDCIL